MFIGHYAAAFALQRADERLSLGWLLLAATWLDLLFSALLLVGVEAMRVVPGITKMSPLDLYNYPYSHSLLFTLLWAGLFFLLPRVIRVSARADRTRAGLVLAAAVVSHWVLDLLVHRPDLPLAPGAAPKFGLVLWDYPAVAMTLEILLYLVGFGLYWRVTRGGSALGRWGMPVFVLLLLALFVLSASGGEPPSGPAFAVFNIVMSLVFLSLAAWLDRKRRPVTGS